MEPPPRRTSSAPSSRAPTPEASGWRASLSARSKVWGTKAIDRVTVISDNVGGKVNTFAENRLGTERFWPVTGDFPQEMDKAARILKTFTVDGIVTEDKKKKVKLVRKIPPKIIAEAKGLAIFTSMRSGIAPFGGAGGAGVVVAKLPDGSWSAPASISPNNLTTGFLLGVDIYDCILVIRTQKALDSFGTHKFTVGTEFAVAAGPYGIGAAAEAGKEAAPVFSYVKSRGLYAGVEVVGQVFVERFEENGTMYHWPGIKARDILNGSVDVPREAASLQKALVDAESGAAQAKTHGGQLEYAFDAASVPRPADDLELEEGEVLKLPPTPEMTDGHECESDPETETIVRRSGLHPPALPRRRDAKTPASLPGTPPPLPARSARRPVSVAVHSPLASDDLIDMSTPLSVTPPPQEHLATAVSATTVAAPMSPESPSVVTPVAPVSPVQLARTAENEAAHEADAEGETDAPPAYDGEGVSAGPEKGMEKISLEEAPTVAVRSSVYGGMEEEEEEMTEGERREWEQHFAAQKEQVQTPAQ